MTKSGVHRGLNKNIYQLFLAQQKISHSLKGTIQGTSQIGAVIGEMSNGGNCSELYALLQVTISACTQSGGLIGTISVASGNFFSIFNSYTRATVTCSSSSCGGITGLTSERNFIAF